jgi:hypothetical protein
LETFIEVRNTHGPGHHFLTKSFVRVSMVVVSKFSEMRDVL